MTEKLSLDPAASSIHIYVQTRTGPWTWQLYFMYLKLFDTRKSSEFANKNPRHIAVYQLNKTFLSFS